MAKRILIGTADIARNTSNLSLGFRELGFEVDTLVYGRSRFYDDVEYTFNTADFLDDLRVDTDDQGRAALQAPDSFYAFADRYDIFIFISGSTLLPRMIDLPLLRAMGKTVVSRHCGTEVRDYELARTFWTDYGRFYPYYRQDAEAPRIACETETDLLGLSRYQPALANKMHNVRTSELYADVVFSGPPSHTLGARPYFQSGPAIDIGHIECRIPRRRVPVILHAPTSSLYKQTDAILQGLDELKDEGLRFHLKLLQEVPNREVCRAITEADIVIDELSCGSGLLAFEGMAGGCAVLGGHDGVSSPLPRNRPVLNITPDNFKRAVREVVENMDLRVRLARLGRDYIDSGVSSPPAIAEYVLQALEREKRGQCDFYPTLFTERGDIPQGEPMPEYLKQRTLDVLLAHGAHPDTDLARLARVELLPEGCEGELQDVPRWDLSPLRQEGPWILMHETAQYGSPHPVPVMD